MSKITRKIGKKALLHHVLLVTFKKKDSDECYLVPIAEMITDDSTGTNIAYFLNKVKSRVSPTLFKLLSQIGTDDSWPNIHAILSLSNINISEYLVLAYTLFKTIGKNVPKKLLNVVSPAFCFSHLSKNWSKDMEKSYDDINTQRQMRRYWSFLTTISDAKQLDEAIKAILVLLASPRKGKLFTVALQLLEDRWGTELTSDDKMPTVQEAAIDEPVGKAIYRDSPFYQKYRHYVDCLAFEKSSSKAVNLFHSTSLLEKFLMHYVAVLPFWTVIVARLYHNTAERSNNGRIECSFRLLKSDLDKKVRELNERGNIKIGR